MTLKEGALLDIPENICEGDYCWVYAEV